MIGQMKELGIFALAILEELGGTKVSMSRYVHITEELTRGCRVWPGRPVVTP
jgi:alkylation response protein AidB-like acyl-CoA dehydrogenase